MTDNQKKAQEFAEDRGHDNQSITEAFVAALDMAEWKDEQEIEFLQSLIFQASTPKALNIIINNRIKLLKGE